MITNKSQRKAIAWFSVMIICALVITIIGRIVQKLAFQGRYVFPEVSQVGELGFFLLVCIIFYFLPLLQTHYHAKHAKIRWLTILSQVLLIHFYCVLGMAIIIMIVTIFGSI